MVRVPSPNSFSAPSAKLRSVHQRGPLENKMPRESRERAGRGAGHAPSRLCWVLEPTSSRPFNSALSVALGCNPSLLGPIHAFAPPLLVSIPDQCLLALLELLGSSLPSIGWTRNQPLQFGFYILAPPHLLALCLHWPSRSAPPHLLTPPLIAQSGWSRQLFRRLGLTVSASEVLENSHGPAAGEGIRLQH